MFRKLHNSFTDIMCNLFHNPIQSKAFDAIVSGTNRWYKLPDMSFTQSADPTLYINTLYFLNMLNLLFCVSLYKTIFLTENLGAHTEGEDLGEGAQASRWTYGC